MKRFFKGILTPIFMGFILISCGPDDPNSTIIGTWEAKWETDPASFPGVTNVNSFTMNGEVIFYADSVEINAYGFPGCIFSADTLRHSLRWEIQSDTLNLLNEDDVYGMSYTIKEMKDDMIELQLMDDIFLTLIK